jgi:arginyl-tRNA synthetase
MQVSIGDPGYQPGSAVTSAAGLADRASGSHKAGGAGLLDECEAVLAAHQALDRCVSIEPRRREDQEADLRLLFAERSWLRSSAGSEMLAELARHPAVANVQRNKSAVLIRFDDEALATVERRLADGERAGMNTADLLRGHRLRVGFINANTNKALHVGHLRNIVYGHALSSMLGSAGAAVERSCIVGDIGRRVCEAMAGYLTLHQGESPQSAGMAGDRFVELCYRDFASQTGSADDGEQSGDSNRQERSAKGDLADELMRKWLAGAAPERALLERMRGWALSGHERTLARLGVLIDSFDLESQNVERSQRLIASGVDRDVLERDETGSVIYRTGRPEHPTMVIVRGDGALTAFGRCIGAYEEMFATLDPEVVFIEILGDEFKVAAPALGELVGKLLGRASDPCHWGFHGSVTLEGRKMGSSTGGVVWIDDLLDAVAASPAVTRLHRLANGMCGRNELADLIVRGTFLCVPTAQPLPFALDRLVEGSDSAGHTIAHAWARAQCPAAQPRHAPVARTAVVQSQLCRRAMQRAIADRDPAKLAIHLLGLAEACLAAPEPGPADRPILRCALQSLGFVCAAS